VNRADVLIDYAERLARDVCKDPSALDTYRIVGLQLRIADLVRWIEESHPDSPVFRQIDVIKGIVEREYAEEYEAGEIAANALPDEVLA